MVGFLTAKQALGEIEGMIARATANSTIVMISPHLEVSAGLMSQLTNAGRQKVAIIMVCRGKDLRQGEREKLEQIPGLQLHFNERLHASCYYDDETMVITSLNLRDSSLGDSREMGVRLRRQTPGDTQAFEEARLEARLALRECQTDTSQPSPAGGRISQARKARKARRRHRECSHSGVKVGKDGDCEIYSCSKCGKEFQIQVADRRRERPWPLLPGSFEAGKSR